MESQKVVWSDIEEDLFKSLGKAEHFLDRFDQLVDELVKLRDDCIGHVSGIDDNDISTLIQLDRVTDPENIPFEVIVRVTAIFVRFHCMIAKLDELYGPADPGPIKPLTATLH